MLPMRLKLKMKGVIRLSEPPNQRIPAIGSLPLSPDPFHTASLLDTDSGTGHYMGWGRRASGQWHGGHRGKVGRFSMRAHLICSRRGAATSWLLLCRSTASASVAQRRVRRVPACAGGVGRPARALDCPIVFDRSDRISLPLRLSALIEESFTSIDMNLKMSTKRATE
jgi:hypothetical protein